MIRAALKLSDSMDAWVLHLKMCAAEAQPFEGVVLPAKVLRKILEEMPEDVFQEGTVGDGDLPQT